MKKCHLILLTALLIIFTTISSYATVDFQAKTDVPLNKDWTIRFNMNIDESTINEENIYILDSEGNRNDCEIAFPDIEEFNFINITPVSNYNSGEEYTLYIKDVRSTSGKGLEEVVTMNYTTINEDISISFNFDNSEDAWAGDFADLPSDEGTETFYELDFQYADIPVNGQESKGLYIKGNNHSDDLFMYITRKLTTEDGLEPNTEYNVDLSFDMATNVPRDMLGVGGSPGSSIYVKAGIVNVEPIVEVDSNGYNRINIDKANQSQSGEDMILLGNIEKLETDEMSSRDDSFQYKPFEASFEVTTNEEGEAWIIIGTDSGFEALTELYYDDIDVTFKER